MKKMYVTILLLVLILTVGCNKKEANTECCEGCMCGDTIELIKKYETVWTEVSLTKNNDYKFITNTFINFHGTGKERFAYYKNDDENNLIKEIIGKFKVYDNRLVLTPNDGSKEITCTLGEEKDLLAIIECDNGLGTFGLQKEGELNVPDIILDRVERTKTIKVKSKEKEKTVTKEKDIKNFFEIIKNSKVWTGVVNEPGVEYYIYLLDENNEKLVEINYAPDSYFTVIINDASYNLTSIDKNELNKIIK